MGLRSRRRVPHTPATAADSTGGTKMQLANMRNGLVWLAAIAMVAGLAGSDAAAETALTFTGDGTDYITQGLSFNYTDATASFTVSSWNPNNNDAAFSITANNGDWWWVEFAAPTGQPLTPGVYNGCTRYPFNGPEAGFNLSGNGRGCNNLAASFTVHQAVFDQDGNVVIFWASFYQNCEGGSPAAWGEIMYNATTPVTDATWGAIKSAYAE